MWCASSKAKRLRGYDGDEFGEIMICQPIRQERADGVSRTGSYRGVYTNLIELPLA